MKHTLKSVRTLAATLITFGTLAGGAQAALTLTFNETSGNTVVTLTATNFTLVGLTKVITATTASTFIRPFVGGVFFTGTTDISTTFDNSYVIPNFTIGSGGLNSVASGLGVSNPFVGLDGNGGYIWFRSSDVFTSNFEATATYSGNFSANGINVNPQLITLSNGQTLSISAVPEPASALLLGLTSLVMVAHRRRNN